MKTQYYKNVRGVVNTVKSDPTTIYRLNKEDLYRYSVLINGWERSRLNLKGFLKISKEEISEEEAIAHLVYLKLTS